MKAFNPTQSRGSQKTAIGRTLWIWGSLFVAFIVLMGIAFYQGSVFDEQGRRYLDASGNLRLLSQRMTTQSLSAAQGAEQAFLMLKQLRGEFQSDLNMLLHGDGATGLPPLPNELKPELEQNIALWDRFDRQLAGILASREIVGGTQGAADSVKLRLPQLVEASTKVVEILREARTNPNQVFLATRQLVLVERIASNLNGLLSGNRDAIEAVDALNRDVATFSQVVDGMRVGNAALGLERVSAAAGQKQLDEIVLAFGDVADSAGRLVELAPRLLAVKQAATAVEADGRSLFDGVSRIERAIHEYNRSNALWTTAGFMFALLAIASFLMLVYGVLRATNRQLQQTKNVNDRNQQAILTLLDEMATLADGDLTVSATVTEDITGAIADSVNYAVDALRTLVDTINASAGKVSQRAETSRKSSIQLAEASKKQARKIASATDSINDLTHSIARVSNNADISAKVAEQSLVIAQRGVDTVHRTIDGMDRIREHIQDTSKRIKRLGESSQEIGDIVGLITDIAEQTNILALNAAIQASSAGEGGRGFAVVADEVQRLAERAGNASKQIEMLVKTIQSDTHEAIGSMEKSTANVVVGANQAEEAGKALGEIEKVTHKLAGLIKDISEEAREQAIVSGVVAEAMGSIQEITKQTVNSTNETAVALADLVGQAAELSKSVEGFKLPGQDEAFSVASVTEMPHQASPEDVIARY
ncbi:MAG: methyl-accepting chemotaxis protein [Thiotrichales bacterium]